MRAPFVVLLLASACNQAFGLERTHPIDAYAPDTLPATCHVSPALENYAATYLDGSTNRGQAYDLITSAQHPALLSFDVSGLTAGGGHIAAGILTVVPITKCGLSCMPCTNVATMYEAYWNFDGWLENQANAANYANGKQWAAPYAEGSTDRSALVVRAPLPAASPQLDLPLPMALVANVPAEPWVRTYTTAPTERLSIQLRTDDVASFASDDHDRSPCQESANKPTLVLTICQ